MKNAWFSFTKTELLAILVVALGYFVDLFDVLLFSVVRTPSLIGIGITDKAELTRIGINLQNLQMAGLLVGGLLFGIYADKKGRLKVLFVSIILYSVANILNAFVTDTTTYGILRFVAGLGLAGELGVGITYISEKLSPHKRTMATMIVSAIGLLGGVTAALTSTIFDWKTTYIIGGVLGLCLFVFRYSTQESTLFQSQKNSTNKRGDILKLFGQPQSLFKFLICIFAGAPAFVFTAIFIVFSPEIYANFQNADTLKVSTALTCFLVSFSMSDILGGVISKVLKSRKTALLLFALIQIVALYVFLYVKPADANSFYLHCLFLGFSVGYWGILITNAAEQFGTDLRATVTTSVPNIIRGLTIPATLVFKYLLDVRKIDIIKSGAIVGFGLIFISIISIVLLKDKFENDLEFTE
jgi:MFS transporter, putative metabolite:H+ symporter